MELQLNKAAHKRASISPEIYFHQVAKDFSKSIHGKFIVPKGCPGCTLCYFSKRRNRRRPQPRNSAKTSKRWFCVISGKYFFKNKLATNLHINYWIWLTNKVRSVLKSLEETTPPPVLLLELKNSHIFPFFDNAPNVVYTIYPRNKKFNIYQDLFQTIWWASIHVVPLNPSPLWPPIPGHLYYSYNSIPSKNWIIIIIITWPSSKIITLTFHPPAT